MGNNKKKNITLEENTRRKIKKLEAKLKRIQCKIVAYSSSDSADEFSDSDLQRKNSAPPVPPQHQPRMASVSAPSTSTVAMRSAKDEISVPREKVKEVEPCHIDQSTHGVVGEVPEAPMGNIINKAISTRWQEILTKGLTDDVKEMICGKYLVPKNCKLLAAPILNPETKASMTNVMIKSDQISLQNQQQLGTALAALAQATELLALNKATEKVLEPLNDACRFLCDSHYQHTITRRSCVVSSVNPDVKEILVNSIPDKFLFGEKLGDRLKLAKNIQDSGEACNY